jgi:hypothetical protein
MLKVDGFAKDPKTKTLAKWTTEVTQFEHQGQVEMLIHDLTREAEKILGPTFKGPCLLMIENIKEIED